MKKKLLVFLMAICLIISCALFLTACASDPASQGPRSPVTAFSFEADGANIALRDGAAVSVDEEYMPVFDGGTNEFSLWLSDNYNRDTLKVYLNGKEIEWTQIDYPDYDNRKLDYFNNRKIGTFALTDLKGEVNITATCKEEVVNLVFSQQEIEDADKLEILDKFYFVTYDEQDNEVKTSFKTVANEGFTIKSTCTQLSSSDNGIDGIWTKGILVESDAKIGYYNHTQMIVSQAEGIFAGWDAHVCAENKYQSYMIVNADGGYTKEICLSFNIEEIKKSTLGFFGWNVNNTIFSYNYQEWEADFNQPITITLNNYQGVNFENAKAVIYSTEMDFENVDGHYKITIPAGKLPMDYLNEDLGEKSIVNPNGFSLELIGVDIQNANLHRMSVTGVDFTGINMELETPYYSEKVVEEIDGLIYEDYAHYYKDGDKVTEGIIVNNTDLRPSKLILRQKINGEWQDTYVNISSYYNIVPENPTDEYVYENVVDGIDVVVRFSWGQLYSINLRFDIKYETQILPDLT